MPSRIAGITVEIDGNVTGLNKALESVNKTIKTTQSELKDIERLLKLDPSNTELLSQKQEKLKTSIQATKEKLDALKTAQEQAKQQMENGDLGKDKYDALQREIIATEQELARLAKEAANANTALTKIGEAGKSLEKVGDKMSSLGSTLTRSVTAPIVALGTAAIKTTADFDEQMFSALSGPIGIVVAVVAVLAAAFIHLWNTNEEFRNKVTAIWESVKEKFSTVAEKITELLNSLGFSFGDLGEAIKAAWDWLCNKLAPLVTAVMR